MSRWTEVATGLLTLALCACGAEPPERAAGGATPSVPVAREAGSFDHKLVHDGRERRYLAVSPGAREEEKLPLVVVLHGGGGNAEQAKSSMHLGGLVDDKRALVVYPEGTGKRVLGRLMATWNAGACCGDAATNDVDDVGFLDAVIDDVEARYPVDSSRVYLMGHSNGSMMSYRYACAHGDRLAAIAPVGGQPVAPACKPSVPVPTLHLHGEADRCAKYDGGTCGGCFAELLGGEPRTDATWSCSSVPEAISAWAVLQGGGASPTNERDEHGAHCRSYAGGPDVTLCTLPNVGHAFPGGTPGMCERAPNGPLCARWKEITGPVADGFPTVDVLWGFFERHRR